MEALALGAQDYVAKASNTGSLDRSLENLRGELIPEGQTVFSIWENAARARAARRAARKSGPPRPKSRVRIPSWL